jgi:hypothetical protein
MDTKELREQAHRWRARTPGQDPATAEALVAAAGSFEGLADATDETAKAAAPSPVGGAFMHRAYDGPPKKT